MGTEGIMSKCTRQGAQGEAWAEAVVVCEWQSVDRLVSCFKTVFYSKPHRIREAFLYLKASFIRIHEAFL